MPATADDIGWAVITAKYLEKYRGNPRILGLGEMMNVPGVIGGDPEVLAKMSGSPTLTDMPRASPEKTSTGMSTEASKPITNTPRRTKPGKNSDTVCIFSCAKETSQKMSPLTAPRCYFCNDDRHVNLLVREGSIDHCIRVAVNAGVPFELAIRMATLSIAECFGLTDLGLIAPGRRADFCVLAKTGGFVISEVYKNGVLSSDIPKKISPPPCPVPEFNCAYPVSADLVLLKTGVSQVIGIIYGDIVTENTSLLVGGLMTTESAEETLRRLDEVAAHLKRTGTFSQAFGHLSYLSLTIIPHLKITPKGLFDVDAFENMELLQ